MTTATKETPEQELARIQSGYSTNDSKLVDMISQRLEIPRIEVQPRANVFKYRTWKHQGRQVRKGEKGFKITVFMDFVEKDKKTGELTGKMGKSPKGCTVFHISQTEPCK